MKCLFFLITGAFFSVTISAADLDSLEQRTVYQKAWQVAMQDGKISPEERPLLNILGESQGIPKDSSRSWEIQWRGPSKVVLDQSGRWPLVAQNMVLGVGLYGWAIPYVLHAEDSRWIVGSEMLSLGSAFYLTYNYTRNKSVTHAQTQMMRYGELIGLRYGLGINQLLDLDSGDDTGDGSNRETPWAWVLMASVPAGHYAGEYLFDRYQPSNGQAWAWTMWTGVAGVTARLIQGALDSAPSEPDFSMYYSETEQALYDEELLSWKKRVTSLELLAYPLGAVGGYYLTRDKTYSFGDALMLFQGWGYGYFSSMMLQSLLFDNGDEDVFFMNAGLGAIANTFVYDRLIRGQDYSFGESILMALGSGSGIAFGFGAAIILNLDKKEPLLGLALAGYGAGTYLTHMIIDPGADGSLSSAGGTRISMMPTVLTASTQSGKAAPTLGLGLNISFR